MLDLRSKASLLSLPVAFVSGSVVPSTADSRGPPRVGSSSFLEFPEKDDCCQVSLHSCFICLPCSFSSSDLQFGVPEKTGCVGLNLGRNPLQDCLRPMWPRAPGLTPA